MSSKFTKLIALTLPSPTRRGFTGLMALAVFALALSGCNSGVENFSKLDSQREEDKAHAGVLVPEELDVNGDGFITPEELQGANTYTRSVEKFLADGDSMEDRELNKEEFAKALLGERMPAWQLGLIALAVVIIPVPIGFQLAKSLRMPDHGWKMALVLLSLSAGGAIAYFGWPPKQGIDLSGGIILIYEIDEEATKLQLGTDISAEDSGLDSDQLAAQLRRRINPGGVSEIVVRPYGPRQVEIIIPNVEEAEIDFIRDKISKTGQLEFLIVANTQFHLPLRTEATEKVNSPLPAIKRNGQTVARWVPVGVSQPTRTQRPNYRGIGLNDLLRARRGTSREFEIVDNSAAVPLLGNDENNPQYKQAFDQLGYRDLQVLLAVDEKESLNVKGQHLRTAQVSSDEVGRPAVRFFMTSPGSKLLGRLTSKHQPDANSDFRHRMAIVMDNEVISAPSLNAYIDESGIITGDFTMEEVTELVGVLNAGRLPAVMRKDPISENRVSSLLGADTIRSGAFAISLSLVAVLIFMVIYYRFAGIVACLALLANLLLILALMILVKATFTLPGIAGLVLTVGMSVDANVLIFERIREELSRGAALRMAIRNGFQRATTTIVDANLTTLITAIVLYVIGTDQIRGFAVTLILGILMSMYTAIFCSRVVFDVAERKRWISKLGMMQIVGNTGIDFIGRRRIAAIASIVLISIGLAAVIARGKNLLDIDFNGGTSVQMLLKSPMSIADVRSKVEDGRLGDVSVVGVPMDANGAGEVANTGEYLSFIVNSSITGEEPPEEGDPVKHELPGEDEAREFTVASVNAEKETADLKGSDGNVITGVKWDAIQRVGVDVVEQRIRELFPTELQLQSMEVSDLAAVNPEDDPPADPPETGGSDEPNNDGSDANGADADGSQPEADPSDIDVGDSSEPAGDGSADDATTPEADGTATDGTAPDGTATDGDSTDSSDTNGADDPDPTPDPSENNPTADGEDAGGAEEPAADESGAVLQDGGYSFVSFQADDELPAGGEEASLDDEDATLSSTGPDATAADDLVGRTKASLKFDHAVTAASVRKLLDRAVQEKYGDVDLPAIIATSKEWDGASGQKLDKWDVEIPMSAEAAGELLDEVSQQQSNSPVWLSSNNIGGQVAGNLQKTAIAALLASLLGIIGYIWLRFQRVVFGLAAVVALVHDVLITLGAIALSLWIAKATMGVLLVDEFKISLPIVAALLTIIGYSLNDTIVVFDRIREVRGKNPDLTQDMINTSINQTLGRTLLTSLTTLIVVLMLYILGGQAIRGFAFALLIGVVVGTYSSIFVASPSLLWMMNATKEQKVNPEKTAATTDV